jgi:hypothetical protein
MGRDRGDISSRPSAAGFPPSHRHPTSGDFLLLAPFLVASYTAAGDMNLYRYVGNSTPDFTDPSGLEIVVLFPPTDPLGLPPEFPPELTWTGAVTDPISQEEPVFDPTLGGSYPGVTDPNTTTLPSPGWEDYMSIPGPGLLRNPFRLGRLICEFAKFTGRMHRNSEVIGRGSGIDKVDQLVEHYGGTVKGWTKKKGVDDQGCEWHWYEHHGIGKKLIKRAGEPDPRF